jgi:hypothetical protein
VPPPPAATADIMILRHGADGLYEVYDLGNNAILAAYSLGQVGTDWAFVTLGGFYDGDTSDMLLRNSNTGGFQVYDISNNNITARSAVPTTQPLSSCRRWRASAAAAAATDWMPASPMPTRHSSRF